MDVRIHPLVSEKMIKGTELTFSKYFYEVLDELLKEDVLKELSEERYKVLEESIRDHNKDRRNFNLAIDRFLNPDARIKDTFKTLILCYASVGVIPVTQKKLGGIIETFIKDSGGWTERTSKYKDAMKNRLPGSFENGKRR